jgi:hypothetical protein
MRRIAEVGNLVAHAGGKNGSPPVAQLALQLAGQDVDHVPAVAPVIGQVAGRVLDDAKP